MAGICHFLSDSVQRCSEWFRFNIPHYHLNCPSFEGQRKAMLLNWKPFEDFCSTFPSWVHTAEQDSCITYLVKQACWLWIWEECLSLPPVGLRIFKMLCY